MTTPAIPPQNGKKVTTRSTSWHDLVAREWGAELNKPDIAYQFSNGVTKDCTDRYQSGIYRRK